MPTLPRVALLCHDGADIDATGLASWLASRFELAGVITIRSSSRRWWRAVRREWRRSGTIGLLDVLAFRTFYALRQAARDIEWEREEVRRLRARYPAAIHTVPRMSVSNPNCAQVRSFLRDQGVNALIARCKVILKPEIFAAPTAGTFVFHPGICPEYRNAHGCFWALAQNDLDRVGMTVLRVDRGVDTGPIFLQAGYAFDEHRESHVVIQHRSVLENLDQIGDALEGAIDGSAAPIRTAGRWSAVWGQPTLSGYFLWRRAARERARHVDRFAPLS
jgi:hypothetical protein